MFDDEDLVEDSLITITIVVVAAIIAMTVCFCNNNNKIIELEKTRQGYYETINRVEEEK